MKKLNNVTGKRVLRKIRGHQMLLLWYFEKRIAGLNKQKQALEKSIAELDRQIEGPAICHECGKSMGYATPTGRRKKQVLCGRCRWRAWHANQPVEKKRERWRQDYKNRKKTKIR